MGTLADKINYLVATKSSIASAIEAKGVTIPEGTTFRGYAELIAEISTGGGSGSVLSSAEKELLVYAITNLAPAAYTGIYVSFSDSCFHVHFITEDFTIGSYNTETGAFSAYGEWVVWYDNAQSEWSTLQDCQSDSSPFNGYLEDIICSSADLLYLTSTIFPANIILLSVGSGEEGGSTISPEDQALITYAASHFAPPVYSQMYITESGDYFYVHFMSDSFNISAYNSETGGFTANGDQYVRYDRINSEWGTLQDARPVANAYAGSVDNIKYSTSDLICSGVLVFAANIPLTGYGNDRSMTAADKALLDYAVRNLVPGLYTGVYVTDSEDYFYVHFLTNSFTVSSYTQETGALTAYGDWYVRYDKTNSTWNTLQDCRAIANAYQGNLSKIKYSTIDIVYSGTTIFEANMGLTGTGGMSGVNGTTGQQLVNALSGPITKGDFVKYVEGVEGDMFSQTIVDSSVTYFNHLITPNMRENVLSAALVLVANSSDNVANETAGLYIRSLVFNGNSVSAGPAIYPGSYIRYLFPGTRYSVRLTHFSTINGTRYLLFAQECNSGGSLSSYIYYALFDCDPNGIATRVCSDTIQEGTARPITAALIRNDLFVYWDDVPGSWGTCGVGVKCKYFNGSGLVTISTGTVPSALSTSISINGGEKIVRLNDDLFVVCVRSADDGTLRIASYIVVGGAVPTSLACGIGMTLFTASAYDLFPLDSSRFILSYKKSGYTDAFLSVITVTPSDFSVGSEFSVCSNSSNIASVYAAGSNRLVVVYCDTGDANKVKRKILNAVGNTITVESAEQTVYSSDESAKRPVVVGHFGDKFSYLFADENANLIDSAESSPIPGGVSKRTTSIDPIYGVAAQDGSAGQVIDVITPTV